MEFITDRDHETEIDALYMVEMVFGNVLIQNVEATVI